MKLFITGGSGYIGSEFVKYCKINFTNLFSF